MTHCWLLITLSWFGTASLQYINPVEPVENSFDDPTDSTVISPSTYNPALNYKSFAAPYQQYVSPAVHPRGRRTIDANLKERWANLIDSHFETDNSVTNQSPFVAQNFGLVDENSTRLDVLLPMDKKNFSPWGGKRAHDNQMWTWKRNINAKQPGMPKRVRFSPWGGKRSGQMLLKSGLKGARVLYTNNLSDMARLVSNISPEDLRIAEIKIIPNRRHPINFLTIPFQTFIENLPSLFQSGHPYSQINLKKDGKRKVKFSSWGGKRSQPIIGPIWTPSSDVAKDASLNAIVLIRNIEKTKEQNANSL